jgi:hypothetical protein
MGGPLGCVTRQLKRVVLTLIHIVVLTISYVYWFYHEFLLILKGGKMRVARAELEKVKRIPGHVGLVIEQDPTDFRTEIVDTLAFMAKIEGISTISLFFKDKAIDLPDISPKIKTYRKWDVDAAFREVMEKNIPLGESTIPFEKKQDLVIIYSTNNSLCNFFPWNLDLTTFALSGPLPNLSPYSVVQGMKLYEETEQRFGK